MNEFVQLAARQVAEDIAALPATARRALSGERRLHSCRNVEDMRQVARRRIPRAVFDFVDGAAGDEVTAARNRADFDRYALLPRVLAGAAAIDLSTTVLGQPVRVPLLGAPTGLTGLVHHRGEVAVARALHAAGGIYVQSTMSSYSIEELAAEAPGPTWFQLYGWRDRGLIRELLSRARAAGHAALMLTVDTPTAGTRERDLRNGFGIPPRLTARSLAEGIMRPRWSVDFVRRPRMAVANVGGARAGGSVSLAGFATRQFDPGFGWNELAWVSEVWAGPLAVKGVLRAEEAQRAVRLGAGAVIVSNHGGRQLDHAPSAIAALPAVAEAVGEESEVYLDGGIRRGVDIVKALALGARACLAGRALVYGLAAGGDAGVERAMQILVRELELALTLLGCPSVRALDAGWLAAAS